MNTIHDSRTLVAAGAVTLATLMSSAAAEAQSPADSAWSVGNVALATDLYGRRLASDSTDVLALHRMALVQAWEGRYEESLVLFDRLLYVAPDHLEARVDRARVVAWSGDLSGAIRETERVLETDPAYVPALAARARFEAWSGDLNSAIALQSELLDRAPADREAWRAQATYLAWDDQLRESVAIYDSLLRTDPGDRDALLGLATALSWSNQLDSAAAVYEGMLAEDPLDVEAQMGYARVAGWGGKLKESEARWRRAVTLGPENAAAHAGLGQTLRWQGREAAALESLTRATELGPGNREATDELVELRRELRPRAAVRLVYVGDSDQNDILTAEARGSWHPTASLRLKATAYVREARLDGLTSLDRSAGSLLVGGTFELEPGWGIAASLGAGTSDGSRGTTALLGAGIVTPGRNAVIGSLGFSRAPLDESALLIENGIVIEQLSAGARSRFGPHWRVDVSASGARFDGSEANRRLAGSASVLRTLSSEWNVGLFTRAFGFEKNLNDGYFDPDWYWIGELTGHWGRTAGVWRFTVDAAPGVQQVGAGGDFSATLRGAARIALDLGPGREIGLDGFYSTTGLNSFATGSSDYQYTSIALGGTWTF